MLLMAFLPRRCVLISFVRLQQILNRAAVASAQSAEEDGTEKEETDSENTEEALLPQSELCAQVFVATLSSDEANSGSHCFMPVELKQVAKETRQFTRDGFACSAANCDPTCNADACFLPDQPYECTDHRGHHCWLNPPVDCSKTAIQHHFACKAQNPTTSMCILVPCLKGATFWPLLKGLQRIRTYPKGSSIFQQTASDGSVQKPSVPWPTAVFYDPPNSARLARHEPCHSLRL